VTDVGSDVDFICLGAGIGGLTAAITAHDLGLSVLVIEKSDQLGGVAAYSSAQIWAPATHLTAQQGVQDSWEAGYEYLEWLAEGTADPVLLERMCRTIPEVVEAMEKAGVRWVPLDLADNYWPEAPGSLERGRYIEVESFDGKQLPEELRHIVRKSPTNLFSNHEIFHELGGPPNRLSWDLELAAQREADDIRFQGSALAAYQVMALHRRGIPVLTEAIVTEVVASDGRVTGVVAQVDGEERRFHARRGVLVAMGGYDWNPELTLRYDGRKEPGSRAPRSVTGDHFALLEPLGAETVLVPREAGLGFREPPEHVGDTRERFMPFWSGWPHSITVNRTGRRFGDEGRASARSDSHPPSYARAQAVDESGEQPNFPCWGIFDSQYREKYPIGRVLPGAPLPECFVEAPSLAELAEKLGIDAAGLEDEVARVNEFARAGEDPDFGSGQHKWAHYQFGDPTWKPNPNLGPIEKAPFYGVRLELVQAALTQVGLRTDVESRVIGADGEPIEGLYATGNSMSWRDMGVNYHSGSANMRGMVWGYIAAQHAAGGVDAATPVGAAAGE
jgi:3-oxosteroid 1-dehydrogenase